MNDMNTQIDIAVVARIRKALNLSKDGAASENERELAAAKAQKWMLEHNISIATVEASHDTSTVIKRRKEGVKGAAMYAWQKSLMSQVASANFCYVTSKQEWIKGAWRTVGYELVGREENIVGATELFEYLRGTTERLAQDYVGGDYRKKMSKDAMSFKAGCAGRIAERVRAQHREALAEQKAAATAANASSGTALVPIMADYAEAEECANEDFRLGLQPGTTARNRFVTARKANAYHAACDALATETFEGVIDRALLDQAARDAALDKVGTALGGTELEDALEYAAKWSVEYHCRQHDPKKKTSRSNRTNYRRYSGGSSQQASLNYDAHDAGRRAGNDVGLDKQVGQGSNAKLIK